MSEDNGKVAPNVDNNWVRPDAPKPIEQAPSAIPASVIYPIPLGPRVLVKVDAAAKMIGSIVIPDASSSPPLSGEVLAYGEGLFNAVTGTLRAPSVQKGDIVYFSRFVGTDLEIGGQSFKLLHQDECDCRMPRAGEYQYEEFMQERANRDKLNQLATEQKKNEPRNLAKIGLVEG